jgi:hypothetical protein
MRIIVELLLFLLVLQRGIQGLLLILLEILLLLGWELLRLLLKLLGIKHLIALWQRGLRFFISREEIIHK